MIYKKIQHNEGDYKDENEVRFNVLQAHEAWTPEGKNVGWEYFSTKEACLKEWGLEYDPLPGGDDECATI